MYGTRVKRSSQEATSTRVLRALLRQPENGWNLLRLAEAAKVSYAQAYKVKTALLDHDWLEERGQGRFKTVRLTRLKALLEAWRVGYEPSGKRTSWYTMLERDGIERALERLNRAAPEAHIALASFSAARHLAPYARVPTEFFYADQSGLSALREALKLQAVDTGENIVVSLEPDEGVFLDAITENSPMLTSLVQTYLDLELQGFC